MACDNITEGRLTPCKSVGGIDKIYFINKTSVINDNKILDTNDVILSFTGGAVSAFEYDLRGGQSFDETNENTESSSFFTATGTIALAKQDAVTRKQLKLMAYGRPIVLVKSNDGSFKIYGIENGCDIVANSNSGSAMGDVSGYSLTITSMESEPAYFVDDSAVAVGSSYFNVVKGV